jgi:hypothetical protein
MAGESFMNKIVLMATTSLVGFCVGGFSAAGMPALYGSGKASPFQLPTKAKLLWNQ